MSYPEIIFIEYSNNPSPFLQKFASYRNSILNKNTKNAVLLGKPSHPYVLQEPAKPIQVPIKQGIRRSLQGPDGATFSAGFKRRTDSTN
jgi:hypothetical protein